MQKVEEKVVESVVTPSPMPEPPVVRESLRMPKKQKETPNPPPTEQKQDYSHKEAVHRSKIHEHHDEKPNKKQRQIKKVKIIEEAKEETTTQVKKFKPMKHQSETLDFENTNGSRKKVKASRNDDSSSDDDRVPLYLSIVLIDA